MATQGLHMQHMAVYAAYGCWLAGHREPTDLRGSTHLVVKWSSRGPNSKQHYCKQQATIQQYSNLQSVTYKAEATILPTCRNCTYCHMLHMQPLAAKCSQPAAKCTPADVPYRPVGYPVAYQTTPYSAICCICRACAAKCNPQAATSSPQASNSSP